MSVRVTLAEAQSRLPDLLAQAEAGVTVVIIRPGGRDIVLTPANESAPPPTSEKPFAKLWGAWKDLGPPPPDDAFLSR